MSEEKKNIQEEKMEQFEDITIESSEEEKVEVAENSVAEEESHDTATEEKKTTRKGKRKKTKDTKTEVEKLKEELEETKQKLGEQNDKHLRLFSEFDNFRKRTLKEKVELSKTASERLIKELLPVVDDFERAMVHMEKEEGENPALEGVKLIYNKYMKVLKAEGLECMDSKGKDFDTDYHEALTNIPAPSEELKGKVVDVIETGYTLNGKVIRYAKVVVGQ